MKDIDAIPHIEEPDTPRVDPATSFLFWAYYNIRHWIGPQNGGLYYGPKAGLGFLKWLEKRILEQSIPYGEVPAVPVPRVKVEDLSPEDFKRIHLASNTPVVIEGMAKDWRAVKEWSPLFLKGRYGKEVIPVRVRGDAIDESSLRIRDTTLAELVDDIYSGGKLFGANIEDVFNHNPELREALDIKMLTDYGCEGKHSKIGSTQYFISGGGTRSGLHCTGGINLFVQIYGRKEWTLVSPKFSKWLYPATRKDMFYAASPIDWKRSYEELDRLGWPLYKYIPKYVTMLEPGDVLLSPQWWWHSIYTPEPAIGVATRAMNRFILGNKVFSWMWVTSPQFWKLVSHLVKTGWGSDASSGARLAFEAEFVDKATH